MHLQAVEAETTKLPSGDTVRLRGGIEEVWWT